MTPPRQAAAEVAELRANPPATKAQLAEEAAALLAGFSAKAEGPTEAARLRTERVETVELEIATLAKKLAYVAEGTDDPEKLVGALKSLSTAKFRFIAAVNAIPDEILVPGAPPAEAAEEEDAGY